MAAREFHCVIVNQWDNPLVWNGDHAEDGVWQEPWLPSKVPGAGKIEPSKEGEWRCESSGVLTGTSGWARWGVRVVDVDDHFEFITINWRLDYFNDGHFQACIGGVSRVDPNNQDDFSHPDLQPPLLEIVPAHRSADGSLAVVDGHDPKTGLLVGLSVLPPTYFFPNLLNSNLEHPRVDFIVRRRANVKQASTSVDPAVQGVIYVVDPVVDAALRAKGGVTPASGGALKWFRHLGREDGSFNWEGPKQVGVGWGNFKQLFSGGDGIIYGLRPVVPGMGGHLASGGELMWYRHIGRNDGSFQWQGPRQVGSWNLKQMFSGGDDIIYGVTPVVPASLATGIGPGLGGHPASGGDLMWYRHLGREDGSFRWEGPKKVGTGWGDFTQMFSGGDGIIYAVTNGGDLMWFRHTGRADGSFRWAENGGKKVGNGWNVSDIFSG